MKGFTLTSFFLFLSSLFFLSFLGESRKGDIEESKNGIYIVYMGAATTANGSSRADHLHLLNYLSVRKQNAVVHNYKNGFSGIAARLTKDEAHSIAQQPGVLSVFPDPLLPLHTTRSWDFLNQNNLETSANYNCNSGLQFHGSDTIIGILDTGIWPESESFSDKDMSPIPSRWKGVCMKGARFSSSDCNKKLIGARYYSDPDNKQKKYQTPRDFHGHGTHVASTAAGTMIPNASYYGLATGTATGGSSKSRIAIYRVCSPSGLCRGSSILAAFDDAISDGVDVLSLSLGSSAPWEPNLSDDPIAIGAFHAVEKGILVVCSAGNDGPGPKTVTNGAPWILTVAATTIDRSFQSNVVLGGNKVIKGEGIHFATTEKSPIYPLVHAKSAARKPGSKDEARKCEENSLDPDKIKGNIVLCESAAEYFYPVEDKVQQVMSIGGIGLVLVDDQIREVAFNSISFPTAIISSNDAAQILSYINSTRNPTATILPTETVTKNKPAPIVAYFSSRGPPATITNLLKPDIAAPGVNILAAWTGSDMSLAPKGQRPPLFNIISGTSMSCPHVSGIAARIKSENPTWSPSAIRSAIMTTATQTNNLRAQIMTDSGSEATPYDYGAGEVNPLRSLQPGLVYETNTIDYLLFLCYYGYDLSTIKLISPNLPNGFACPNNTTTDLISSINYPSIAISKFGAKQKKTVSRTVTNVGADDGTIYTVSVEAPTGLKVEVVPNKLQFSKKTKKLSYQVTFSYLESSLFDGQAFGSILWTSGKYRVRSPFVVST